MDDFSLRPWPYRGFPMSKTPCPMKSPVSLGLILLKHFTGGGIALQDAVCSMFAAEKASTSAMGGRAAA